jgi:hypothetical protein
MTTRALFTTVSAVFVTVASILLVLPASAQRGAHHEGHPAREITPRANEGRVPPAPQARSDPAEPRQAERLPTGYVNDTPHVNHSRWYGHEASSDARFHIDRPFAHGYFAPLGPAYRHGVLKIDQRQHRFWISDGGFFEVAAWEWPLCEDWCWTCGDDFVVYTDPDHAGWYLLYDLQTGAYVHCQYLGTT